MHGHLLCFLPHHPYAFNTKHISNHVWISKDSGNPSRNQKASHLGDCQHRALDMHMRVHQSRGNPLSFDINYFCFWTDGMAGIAYKSNSIPLTATSAGYISRVSTQTILPPLNTRSAG